MIDLDIGRGLTPWAQLGAIIAATFVSEDLTCIASGLLIRSRQLDGFVGVAGCFLGIFVGDMGLWLMGRACGRRVLDTAWVRRRVSAARIERMGDWFDRRGWTAIVAARFVPGTRLPVYLGAGMLGRRADRFVLWAMLAALVWTPLLVLLVAATGEAVVAPLRRFTGSGGVAFVAALLLFALLLRGLTLAATSEGRSRLAASVCRLWQWEFWPAWLFYAPLAPWLAWLAIRHRGFTTFTAANPAIPHGGVVGESKYDILRRLPAEWTVPSALIAAGATRRRLDELHGIMAARGWTYPLILKPDVGQRGVGLKKVGDARAAEAYLTANPDAVLAQVFHPGPYEAGVFYYRLPDQPHGRVFSITDKQFPIVIGDGISSLESLIRKHRRYRMQADTFLARLGEGAHRVPAACERVQLAIAGNHCQGTLFRHGAHLITPELEAAIDAIAQRVEGFHFGRFDIRYSNLDWFRAGRELAIVELNGVTSESTNIYDPSWPLWRAYAVLFRQWSILFRIGAANRRRGHAVSRIRDMLRDARAHYRNRRVSLVAD